MPFSVLPLVHLAPAVRMTVSGFGFNCLIYKLLFIWPFTIFNGFSLLFALSSLVLPK